MHQISNNHYRCVLLPYFRNAPQYIIISLRQVIEMGTSMSVPDSVQARLARKAPKHNENRATNNLTLAIGENIQEKINKLSLPSLPINEPSDKMKDSPETAVTEENQPDSPTKILSLKDIQVCVTVVKEVAQGQESQSQQADKQNPPRSIWQNVTEQTKIHFKNADERRKKSILGLSSLIGQEHNIGKHYDELGKDKWLSEVYSERANQLFLSINSKFAHREHPIPETARPACQKSEERNGRVVKKAILLPNVEIINSEKERKKLKYVCRQQEEAHHNWRNTS